MISNYDTYEEGVLARQLTLFDDLEESEKILKEHKIISAFTGMVPQVRKSQLTAGKQPAVMRPPSPHKKTLPNAQPGIWLFCMV